MQMAIEYMRINNLARARERIERALNEEPDNANVQETAGLVYERLNEMPKARAGHSTAPCGSARTIRTSRTAMPASCAAPARRPRARRSSSRSRSNPVYQTPEVALVNAGVCVARHRRCGRRGALFQARAGDPAEHARGAARDRAISRSSAAMRSRRSNTCSAIWRSISRLPRSCGWGTARSASSATASGAADYARRIQTEFPDSEQAQALRSGGDQ